MKAKIEVIEDHAKGIKLFLQNSPLSQIGFNAKMTIKDGESFLEIETIGVNDLCSEFFEFGWYAGRHLLRKENLENS